MPSCFLYRFFFFFFNDTATTEIYTLSLHDALPILKGALLKQRAHGIHDLRPRPRREHGEDAGDRKSTRLNSSHSQISYAVFCLKKKKTKLNTHNIRQVPYLRRASTSASLNKDIGIT